MSSRNYSSNLLDGFHSQSGEVAENGNFSSSEVAGDQVINSSNHVSVVNGSEFRDIPSLLKQTSSLGEASSSGASLRRLFSLSGYSQAQLEDVENEIVSQAGDIGDRTLSRSSLRGSGGVLTDQGVVFPIPEELLDPYGIWSGDPSKLDTVSPVTPITTEIMNPFLKDHADSVEQQVEKKTLPPSFEYAAYLIHLAVFGIFGVLTRYLLQKLFGPNGLGVTSDGSISYLDLPSNMVGSFLMGWFGIVFKANISRFSDQLAIGLSTGYLGSLTTFSGWNQKMLELSAHGQWVFAILGFLIGLFLAAYSIMLGVETAEGFRWILIKTGIGSSISHWKLNSFKSHLIAVLLLMLMWAGLWTTSGIMEKREFKEGGSGAQLWLACFVGPVGVWIRWRLARLNGCGLGRAGLWKWIPFGTLIANVSAACVMAALANVKKAVNTKDCDTVASGIQFGLMGCLSTVSTFMAEFNAMRQSSQPWRAYAYAALTIGISFGLGTLIYSVPVWTKGYS